MDTSGNKQRGGDTIPAGINYLLDGGFISPRQAQILHFAGLLLVLAGVLAMLYFVMDIHSTQIKYGCAALCVCEDIMAGQKYYPAYNETTAAGEAEEPQSYKNLVAESEIGGGLVSIKEGEPR